MTHHVAHTNKMISELKMLYQDRIDYLQDKIADQQKEIENLQEQIKLLTYQKEYDC